MTELDSNLQLAADHLAAKFADVYQTERTLSLDVGDYYVQCASQGELLLIELPSNAFLTGERQLTDSQGLEIEALGFEPPDDVIPNYSRLVSGIAAVPGIAELAVIALHRVYGVAIETIAVDLGVRLSATAPAPLPFTPTVDDDGFLVDLDQLELDFSAHILISRGDDPYATPHDSDVPPQWFAVVEAISHNAVVDFLALAPRGPANSTATWFRRVPSGWIVDRHRARECATTADYLLFPIDDDMAHNLDIQFSAHYAQSSTHGP